MFNELQVFESEGQLLVDSREVAEMIGKRHHHLVRDIKQYIDVMNQKPDLVSDDYFIEDDYTSGTGKNYKYYLLTRKGCDMVANKLTGDKGILFTAEYTKQFEEMEQKLKNPEQDFNEYIEYFINTTMPNASETTKQVVRTQMIATHEMDKEIEELKPKAEYTDNVLQSDSLYTATQIAKDYGLTARKLNEKLNEAGFIYKQGNTWFTYSRYDGEGYMKTETYDLKNGNGTVMNNKFTEKGRMFIHQLLWEQFGLEPVKPMKQQFLINT